MSKSTNNGKDFYTIKYNSSGTVIWENRYDYQGGADSAVSVSVDDSGNVYVTGSCLSSSNGYDCITLKYNSSGTLQWASVYNGLSNLEDRGLVVIPGDSAVYTCGRTVNSKTGTDYLLVKYNSSGVQQWAVTYNGPVNIYDDYAFDMALDNNDNIYVTGGSYGNGTIYKSATTLKYNSAGTVIWEKRYDGINTYDEAGMPSKKWTKN